MTPRSRIWTLLLLALAALLASGAEASRTSVWEQNPPAAVLAKTDAASLLTTLAPAGPLESTAANAELTEPPRFELGDVVLADTADTAEERFGLGPLDLLGPTPQRGPPPGYPETRVRGLELSGPFRVGASPALSLWPRQACGFSCADFVSDSRQDPWGLASDEELNDRLFADLATGPRAVAYEKDKARRGLSAAQAALESRPKSVLGYLLAGAEESGKEAWAAYRDAPATAREAVRRAWTTREGPALDPDLVAVGGDYGRRTAERGYGVLGDLHGKGAEVLVEGAQLIAEGKGVEAIVGVAGIAGVSGKGPYRDVRGHHVHAKSAFRGHLNYDADLGFSISQELMEERGWRHAAMTSKQRQLFKELSESGRANTIQEHSRIAVEALKAGGAGEDEARRLVAESLADLRKKNVRSPTRIPYSKD